MQWSDVLLSVHGLMLELMKRLSHTNWLRPTVQRFINFTFDKFSQLYLTTFITMKMTATNSLLLATIAVVLGPTVVSGRSLLRIQKVHSVAETTASDETKMSDHSKLFHEDYQLYVTASRGLLLLSNWYPFALQSF